MFRGSTCEQESSYINKEIPMPNKDNTKYSNNVKETITVPLDKDCATWHHSGKQRTKLLG